ncbi:MAG TPA: thiol:disulfide oxidoreductase, partial [Thermosynechococcaceae cyanobacterium]
FLAGDYSISYIASYPWMVPYEKQGQNLADFPHLKRWFETIQARPATVRAYAKADAFKNQTIDPTQVRDLLFGQSAKTIQD